MALIRADSAEPKFYHYLELHHSQTAINARTKEYEFYHYLELHHSQTYGIISIELRLFYHYLELHHSQTMLCTISPQNVVLPLSGITSLSNIQS